MIVSIIISYVKFKVVFFLAHIPSECTRKHLVFKIFSGGGPPDPPNDLWLMLTHLPNFGPPNTTQSEPVLQLATSAVPECTGWCRSGRWPGGDAVHARATGMDHQRGSDGGELH